MGVYFFSQSMGAVEAAEEALFVLELIEPYEVTMPVAFDWEPISGSRAEDIDREELTASAVVFCEMVKDAGYVPCVYLYRYTGYYEYLMERLGGLRALGRRGRLLAGLLLRAHALAVLLHRQGYRRHTRGRRPGHPVIPRPGDTEIPPP